MNKAILFFITILSYCQVFAQPLEVVNLQCEYHSNPLGIENPRPQLCWQLNASQRNIMQTGYRILVSDNPVLLDKNTGNTWDSKKVSSDQSLQIAYSGQRLLPGKDYMVKYPAPGKRIVKALN
jgi:alpha-L-rhamnosidase